MPRQKLTQEFVEAKFSERGFKLLSQYEKSNLLLNFECSKKHKHQIRFCDFQRGQGCVYCSGKVKHTQTFIESEFTKRNWKLLSNYKNSSSLLYFICDKAHKHKISYDNFRKGIGCGKCLENTKHEQKFVEDEFDKRNYRLLSDYKNNSSLLDFICDKGHCHHISYASFKKNHGCGKCAKKAKLENDFIESEFTKRNWKLLSNYKNSSSLLYFICDKGHYHHIRYASFKQGQGCGKCFEEKLKGSTNIAAYNLYDRTKKKSEILPETLLDLCNALVTSELQAIYNNCPQGHHVDHVIPFSWFNHNNVEEIKACWSLENLQYLGAIANIKKRDKLSKTDLAALTDAQRSILALASLKPEYAQIVPELEPEFATVR